MCQRICHLNLNQCQVEVINDNNNTASALNTVVNAASFAATTAYTSATATINTTAASTNSNATANATDATTAPTAEAAATATGTANTAAVTRKRKGNVHEQLSHIVWSLTKGSEGQVHVW